MKCPKCNYVSFEYLERCLKCGKELAEHKSEFGIDFIHYSSINILSSSKQDGAEDIEGDTAVAVAETEDAAVSDISEIAALADETDDDALEAVAEISLDEEPAAEPVEEAIAEISLDEEPAAEPVEEAVAEISLDEEPAAEPEAIIGEDSGPTQEIAVDSLNDSGGVTLDTDNEITLEDTGQKAEEEGSTEIEISTTEISVIEEESEASSPSMPEYPEETVNVDLDSLGLDGLEAAQDSTGSENEKPEKKKEDEEKDETLNINLDDLDLE